VADYFDRAITHHFPGTSTVYGTNQANV